MSDVRSNRLPAAATGPPAATGEAADKIRIVVGVSGSPASALALRWAVAEADRLHAVLEVVLIWTIKPRAHYAPATSAEDADRHRERAVAGLAAMVNAAAGYLPAGAVTMKVIHGTPERALLEQSTGADLVVLGSAAGISGDRAIGPVVRACLSHASCPVLVVGPEGPARQRAAATPQPDPIAIHRARDLAMAASAAVPRPTA